MRIAILGFAGQGQAAYDYWNTPENQITICDRDASITLPADVKSKLGPDYLYGLEEFDLLVRTPALHPRDIANANLEHPEVLTKVTTVTNEFFSVCPTKNVIGVTGTKGKGTTSTLVTKILEAAGKKVHLGGNIGIPPLEMLKNNIQPDDWVVLELANFQLIDLKHSPTIGVCLMVEPEHMDWHDDLNEYVGAKQQLFVHQQPDDKAIFYPLNERSMQVVSVSPGQKIPYYEKPGAIIENEAVVIDGQEICKTNELKLLGKHNWQNVCAAVTATWQITQDIEAYKSIVTNFAGLEHRLEFVRELDGVEYYDDSFGTTPETASVAIEAFAKPKVIILGGSTKGSNFDALASIITASNIRRVILIGNTTNPNYKTAAPEIEAALRARGVDAITSLVRPGGTTMDEIVEAAHEAAQPGDIVLFSAGCASFDMFKNYKDRGEQFIQAVQELA